MGSLDFILENLLLFDSSPKFELKGDNKMQVEWEKKEKVRYFKGNPKKAERIYIPEELPHLIRAHYYDRQLRCLAVENNGVLDTTKCPMCEDTENNYKNNPDAYYKHRRKENYLFNVLRYTDTDDRGQVRGLTPSLELSLWRFSRTTYEDLYNTREMNSSYHKSHLEYDLLVTTEVRKAGEKEFTVPHIFADREAVVLRSPEYKKAMLDLYNRDKYDIEKVFAPEVPDVVIQRAIERAHKFAAAPATSTKNTGASKSHSPAPSTSTGTPLPNGAPVVTSLADVLKS